MQKNDEKCRKIAKKVSFEAEIGGNKYKNE